MFLHSLQTQKSPGSLRGLLWLNHVRKWCSGREWALACIANWHNSCGSHVVVSQRRKLLLLDIPSVMRLYLLLQPPTIYIYLYQIIKAFSKRRSPMAIDLRLSNTLHCSTCKGYCSVLGIRMLNSLKHWSSGVSREWSAYVVCRRPSPLFFCLNFLNYGYSIWHFVSSYCLSCFGSKTLQ